MTAARTGAARARSGPRGALVALCLTQVVGWGVLHYAFPVALPAITAQTGWSPTGVTAAFSAGLVVAAGAGVLVGRRVDHRGPRVVMTSGSVLASAALVAIALAPTPGWFLVAWVLAGVAQAMVLYAPAFTAVTRWYGPARTRALLVLTLVGGLASTVFAPLTAALVEQVGWRATYLVLAALLAVTTVPAHALGLRHAWPPPDPATGALGAGGWRRVARSRAFLALACATALGGFAMSAATIHLVPLLTWRGLTPTAAAWALGLSGAGQLVGRLAYGPLAARTTPPVRAGALLGASAVTVVAVGVLGGPPVALLAAAVALGVARGAYTLLHSTAVADRWGSSAYGVLFGLLNAPTAVAMAVAPWVASALTDATGSYPVTFTVLGVAATLAALVALLTGVDRSGAPCARRPFPHGRAAFSARPC